MPILQTKHGKRDTSPGYLSGGDISHLPCFVGRIGACACSGYQALFPPPPREPGEEASCRLYHLIHSNNYILDEIDSKCILISMFTSRVKIMLENVISIIYLYFSQQAFSTLVR